MGQVNQESNLVNRVVKLERELAAVRKMAGLASAIIPRGGLTLLNNGSLKLLDDNGTERLFVGETSGLEATPQPVFLLRDAAGKLRLAMYDPQPATGGYQPVVWIYDHLDHVAFTTDVNGGVAEPWISVPMAQLFTDTTFINAPDTYQSLPVSACTGGVTWEGRIGKVSHPQIQIDGVWGRYTGVSGSPTYTLEIGGSTVGSWSQTSLIAAMQGPYNIANLLGQINVPIKLKVSATGTGTDRIAINPLGIWLRQT